MKQPYFSEIQIGKWFELVDTAINEINEYLKVNLLSLIRYKLKCGPFTHILYVTTTSDTLKTWS